MSKIIGYRCFKDTYFRYWDNIVILCDNTSRNVQKAWLAEGAEKKNKENARSMKALGVSLDIISQVTGLSLEEIEGL